MADHLTAAAEFAANAPEQSTLARVKVKETIKTEDSLQTAKKVKTMAGFLTVTPTLFAGTHEQTALVALDLKKKPTVQNDLQVVEKEKIIGELIPVKPVLNSDNDLSHTLSALAIKDSMYAPRTASECEEINFDYHVVRALVDLKPLDAQRFTDEFIPFFFESFNERILQGIREDFIAEDNLSAVEKTKTQGQLISADPVLTVDERNNSSLSSLAISDGFSTDDSSPGNEHEDVNFEFQVAVLPHEEF